MRVCVRGMHTCDILLIIRLGLVCNIYVMCACFVRVAQIAAAAAVRSVCWCLRARSIKDSVHAHTHTHQVLSFDALYESMVVVVYNT